MAQEEGITAEGRQLEVKPSKLEGSRASLERGRFIQVFEYELPEGEEIPADRGRLFAVVDLTVGAGADSNLAGKLVWGSLTASYYDPSEEMPIRALEEAVYAARDRLRDFSEGSSLNLVAAAVVGDVAYVGRVGDAVLFLRRGSDVREPLAGEETISISSQILEPDDVLVLGSPVFGKNFNAGNLPQTDFLVKQFEGGARIPGFAAALLGMAETVRTREAAVEKKEVAKAAAKAGRRIRSAVKGAPAFIRNFKLPSFTSLGRRIGGWFKSRVSHGQKLAESRRSGAGRPAVEEIPVKEVKAGGRKIRIPFKLGRRHLSRAILVLLILFAVSISFTTWQQARRTRAAEFERLVTEAARQLSEAEGLVDLSNETAGELLVSALASLDQAGELDPDSDRIEPLRVQATELYNSIEKITPLTDEHLAYDLSLQVEGAQGLALAGTGATLYVAESISGSVFQVNLGGELPQASKLAGGSLTGARDLIWEQNQLYALTDTTLYRYSFGDKKTDEPLTHEGFQNAEALATYLGNIYLLIPQEDQIFRFLYTPNGYSRARNWVEEAGSLSAATDFAVDGDIWITAGQGEIIRMSKGERQPFIVANLSTPFTQLSKIFTLPNYDRLYLLDAGGQRVVMLDKNGNFVRQIKGDPLAAASDIWVSSNEKTLYILSGSRIYRIGL